MLLILNHDSFRMLFDKIASVCFIWKNIYILALEMATQGTSIVPIVLATFVPL